MAGYSGTPLWKKLGYKNGITAYVEGAYDRYITDLQLPPDIKVSAIKQPTISVCFIHLFASEAIVLEQKLRSFRQLLDPGGMMWVSWPKRSSGVASDLTEQRIRDIALPLGFVDVKVCAVNEIWSALKLVIRKELR